MENISIIGILMICIPAIICKESKNEHVVLVPKILRMDTNNTVTVSTTGPVKLQLKLLYADIEQIQKIQLDGPGVREAKFLLQSDKVPSNVHLIYLEVEDLNGKYQKQSLSIPLDRSSGYIIIQLDKPIYKPREYVKYRILAVNEDQSPASRSIKVEVIGPNSIILDSMIYPGEQAFDAKTFYLPKEAQIGKWKIRAYFVGEEGRDQVEEFDVKEYVLPAFKVEIIPKREIILKSVHYIKINIKARYSFNQPVEGTCSLRIGVVKDGDSHISLFDLKIKDKRLSKGITKFNIRRSELEKSHLWFPAVGSRMFIEANVTEKATEIKASAINMSPIFSKEYYDLRFVHSKKRFKPGMPYRLELEVKDKLGKSKAGRLVYINKTLEGRSKLYNNGTIMKVNKNGQISEIIQIPDWCQTARFVVITLDPLLLNQENETLTVYGYTKNSISLAENKLYQKQPYFKVKVAYEYVQDRTMFVAILAKGQIVFTTSFLCEPNGGSIILIPDEYKKELPGHARIIVYHFDKQSKVQAESIVVYFKSQCLEELELSIPDQEDRRPKQNVTVMVNGGSEMRVGFVVVDTSIYDFISKTGLTRDKMFQILGKHDNRNDIVQSKDAQETFEENGLLYLVFPRGFIDRRTNAKGLIQDSHLPDSIFVEKSEVIPRDVLRKYFPESWYFEDFTLDSEGESIQQLKLPDSITTWQIQAVGLSSRRGVCVANSLKVAATLPVFAQVHLPYKAVRLEKVKVIIVVFNTKNEKITIKVNVSMNADLMCPSQEGTVFTRYVQAGKSSSMDFSIIPLKTGDLPLRIAVWDIDEDMELFDAVEKKLFVVPEGKRLKKTITFPLNPQGESFTKKYTSVEDTNKLSYKIETRANLTQKTEVDLALPVEIIPGTEDCGLQACGDLMGDVISTSLYGKENLFVSSFHGVEEVIGNMAPAIYALEYLNSSGLLNKKTLQKGRTFITQGVTRLMKYRDEEGGFSSNAGEKPVIWLTTLVLKTLCHASNLSYVDKILIDSGFTWLLKRVNTEGKPIIDEIKSENSTDYPVVLAAEILIAFKECVSLDMIQDEYLEEISGLEISMMSYIEENIMKINDTMALSKMAYALMLAESPEVDWVLEKLTCRASHTDDSGVSYWAESKDGSKPYWYRQSPDAFAIETTAYALLVHIRHAKLEPAKLADWLIRQRNGRGGFVSPSDTAVAIQALAEFSSLKHIPTTNLHLEISADKSLEFNQVINFNTENAITKKYVMDVPTGEKLLVKANGTGIGQVQVNVAYNVPTAPNDNCLYNLTVTRKIAVISGERDQSGLCRYCSVGCQKSEQEEDESNNSMRLLRRQKRSTRSRRKYRKNKKRHRRRKSRSGEGKRRRKRQRGTPVSRTTLCLKICIQYRGASYSGQTNIEVDMLSGYEPMEEDLKNLKEMTMGRVVHYTDDKFGKVKLFLSQVPNDETLCINFRIKEKVLDSIQFLHPAPVVAYQPSKPEHICLQNYDSVRKDDILPMFCIGEDNRHKGECQCISGTCGNCEKKRPSISYLKKEFCKVDYLYEVNLTHSKEGSVSKHIHGHVKTALMIGKHDVKEGLPVVFSTRKSCTCPSFTSNETLWVLGKNPYRFTNEAHEEIYRYLIDESTSFIRKTTYIQFAFKNYKSKCRILNKN